MGPGFTAPRWELFVGISSGAAMAGAAKCAAQLDPADEA